MQTIDINEYNRLKQQHEAAKQARAQAEGALKPQYARLETEFQCTTLDAARAKLAELKAQQAEALATYQAKFAEYQAQYGDRA